MLSVTGMAFISLARTLLPFPTDSFPPGFHLIGGLLPRLVLHVQTLLGFSCSSVSCLTFLSLSFPFAN